MLAYEEAYFYKLLAETGFEKEVEDWIENILNNNVTLEGINLDLVYNQSNIYEVISCLHNYIGDNQVNDQILCDRLRLFIKEKLDKNEISLDKAIISLERFVSSTEKGMTDYWKDFYLIGAYFDDAIEGLIDKEKYYARVMVYIETGISFDSKNLWRNKRHNKKMKKLNKEARKKHKKQLKEQNDVIRMKYNLAEDIYTGYEYRTKAINSWPKKLELILFILCELLCLGMTIGGVFYFDLISLELATTSILLGITIGLYGFCILLKAKGKEVIYILIPLLFIGLPLVIDYLVTNTTAKIVLILITIIVFSVVLYILIKFVNKKLEKYNEIYNDYWNNLLKKYSKMYNPEEYYHIDNHLTFYKKDGSHVIIFEYKEQHSSIVIIGKVKYKNIQLNNVVVEYQEINDSFDNCVKKGLDILIDRKK
ncbi:MAG: hypothetical protein IJX78_02085 [Bacilli bacterium]|nr:hypothetical protein [Bacilli bacterium]